MKLTEADVIDDDFYTINRRERFDRELLPSDVRLSEDLPIVVRYDYIDLGITDYHFSQTFTEQDTQGYFSKMKAFSGKSINAISREADKHHFYRSPLVGNVKKALQAILPKSIDTNQIVYHFGLYETDVWADRKTDTRCPRVYFLLGTYGHIYILFFDPYHELNPITNGTSSGQPS